MSWIVSFVALLLSSGSTPTSPSGSVVLEITDMRSIEGQLMVAIYSEQDEWLNEESAFTFKVVEVTAEEVMIRLPALPYGNYGIAVLHDRNGDEEMNFNWVGMPKEGYGFSNNPNKMFREPTFEEAKVQVNAPQQRLVIDLYHW